MSDEHLRALEAISKAAPEDVLAWIAHRRELRRTSPTLDRDEAVAELVRRFRRWVPLSVRERACNESEPSGYRRHLPATRLSAIGEMHMHRARLALRAMRRAYVRAKSLNCSPNLISELIGVPTLTLLMRADKDRLTRHAERYNSRVETSRDGRYRDFVSRDVMSRLQPSRFQLAGARTGRISGSGFPNLSTAEVADARRRWLERFPNIAGFHRHLQAALDHLRNSDIAHELGPVFPPPAYPRCSQPMSRGVWGGFICMCREDPVQTPAPEPAPDRSIVCNQCGANYVTCKCLPVMDDLPTIPD